jgi:hypothetical protein
MSKNMSYLCGEAAYKFAHKSVCNLATFTHNPLNAFYLEFMKSYTHFYTSLYNLVYAHKCMQFLPVNSQFYTLYTAPTITTTLNN